MLPELQRRAKDPNINVSILPSDKHRGSALAGLLAFGLTGEALAVMMEMINITVLVEDFVGGGLRNPDLLALKSRRDVTHHRLLSLPTGAALSDSLGENAHFYECCRLAAIMYATAVLFPMPRMSGVPQKLVKEIKSCVDRIDVLILGGGGRHFFIWVLALTGVAALGLPERPWFEEQLSALLTLEGVHRWSELKRIFASFMWMDTACDEGAMELWDEIAATTFLRSDRRVTLPTP